MRAEKHLKIKLLPASPTHNCFDCFFKECDVNFVGVWGLQNLVRAEKHLKIKLLPASPTHNCFDCWLAIFHAIFVIFRNSRQLMHFIRRIYAVLKSTILDVWFRFYISVACSTGLVALSDRNATPVWTSNLQVQRRNRQLHFCRTCVMKDPLHDPVTWYKTKELVSVQPDFPLIWKPLCNVRPSITNSVPCDWIVQRAYSTRRRCRVWTRPQF